MKRLRLCYFIFMGVLFFAAQITGRREFFLLLFMLAFVAAYALALNLWTIFSFTFVQELLHPSNKKGGMEHLSIHIHNDKPFPFTLMKIQVEAVAPSEKTALRFNLSPRDSIWFEVPIHCAYRGEYAVGMTVIAVSDIFGLFEIHYDLRTLPYYRQKTLKIYPRIISLRFLPAGTRDSKLSGDVKVRAGNSGDSFSFPRKYLAGDAVKQIHWQASARLRKLVSKSYDMPAQESVIIAIDNAENGLESEALLQYSDLACECACAIARYCSGNGRKVQLVSAGLQESAPYHREKHDFLTIYNVLAVLPFHVKGGLYPQLRAEIKKDADLNAIYVLSCRQDEELIQFLTESAKAGCDVKYLFLRTGCDAVSCDSLRSRGIPCVEVTYGGDIASVLEGWV